MATVATTWFLWRALGAVVLAFLFTAFAMGAVATFKKGWTMALVFVGQAALAVASVALTLSAVLNVAVFLIGVAKV